jgi:hypothetical protein
MRRLTIAGACVFALFLAAGTTASAVQPEFYVATGIGKVAPSVPFTGTIGTTELVASTLPHPKITCTGGTVSGIASTATEAKSIKIVLTGCESSALTAKCQSAGASAGEIEDHVLEGVLGNVATGAPGLRLANEPLGPGHEFAEFNCSSTKFVTRGSVIAKLKVNTGTVAGPYIVPAPFPSLLQMVFKQASGIQKFVEFIPGEPPGSEQLEATAGGPYEKVGAETTFVIQSTPPGVLGITE